MADAARMIIEVDDRPARGRPRDEGKNVAILDAAVNLFLEKGYDATSMDEIARSAGVSKQTVYSHFEGKQGLFATAIRSTIEEYGVRQALESIDEHTLEDDLYAVCLSFASLLVSEDAVCMFRVLTAQAAQGPELANIFWESGPAIMLDELDAFLESWVERGELKICNIRQASKLLFALLKSDVHFTMAIGLIDKLEEGQLEAHVQSCVDFFLMHYRADG